MTPEGIDEATVIAMSHALLDAEGKGDDEAFARATGQSFVLFEDGQVRGRDELLKALHSKREHPGPFRSLTYGEEHISRGPDSAVFVGNAVEHFPSVDGGTSAGMEGWNTLVWVRDGGSWKAAVWQFARAGLEGEKERWNATYRDGISFTTQPSQFLAEVVRGRPPGHALDVAMGQGRNSLYLASQGWRVTGIDISDEGLRLARKAASERKLIIETINADETTWDFGVDHWDLVARIYAGCSANNVATLRQSVKQGGLVVVEGFHKDADPAHGFETGALAAMFAKEGFTVLRDEVVEDLSDWGRQRQKLVRFLAQKR